jgi:hypothetical protein
MRRTRARRTKAKRTTTLLGGRKRGRPKTRRIRRRRR